MNHFALKRTAFGISGILGLAVAATALATADAAKDYVKQAEEKIAANDIDGTNAKLELAETELDGVAAAEKAPVDESIKALRAKMIEATAAADKPKYQRKLRNLMDDAESAIGNLVTWPGVDNQANELFDDKAAQAALGADLEAAKKKFATFKKLHAKKAGAEFTRYAEDAVKQAEDKWAEVKPLFKDADASPNSKSGGVEDTERAVESARRQIAKLPPDDEKVKDFNARLAKVAGEFTQIALADRAKEIVTRLKDNFDSYKDEYEGWEKEEAGPTWADYKSRQGGAMSAFLAPKTKGFISRADYILAGLEENGDYKSVAESPDVKAWVADVRKHRDEAYAKMLKFVTPVVESAEKDPIKETNDFDRLKDDVRLALGEKSKEGLEYQERLAKKLTAHEAATTGAEQATIDLIKTLREKADAAWPDLHNGIDATTDIPDLAKMNGKTITFTSDNLMGYRFKSDAAFYFATTLNGHPVAAKFDGNLLAAIKEIESKIGRSIGDDDGDGKWEVIAVVTDAKAKLMAKRESEATGTIGDASVKLTGQYAEPVDAFVINIIAAKCGPFAGAKDRGSLKPDGSLAK